MSRLRCTCLLAVTALLGCSELIESNSATYEATQAPSSLAQPQLALQRGAMLGASLALGDDELIAAAPGALLAGVASSDDDNCGEIIDAETAGRVFAYTPHDGQWTGEAREIRRSRAREGDGLLVHLGFPDQQLMALARSGDVLAVGLPGMDHTACASGDDVVRPVSNAGGVYVFERDHADRFRSLGFVPSPNPTTDGLFGVAVALRDDLMYVGAPGETTVDSSGEQLGTKGGMVYVFERDGDGWTERTRITATNPGPDASFGNAIAIDGDTIAIGAFLDPHAGRGVDAELGSGVSALLSGAVYVFIEHDGSYELETYIKAENADPNDAFGMSLALEGDTLAVGAPLESSEAPSMEGGAMPPGGNDNAALGAGAVYVYERTGRAWRFKRFLKAPKPQAGAAYGISLSLRDGRLAVGAASEGAHDDMANAQHDDSGSAYLYDLALSDAEPQIFRPDPDDRGGLYGFAVALGPRWLAIGGPGAHGKVGDVRIYDLDR